MRHQYARTATTLLTAIVGVAALFAAGLLVPASAASPSASRSDDPPTMYVDVSVATVWTNPEKPRPVDAKALSNPVDIRGWLADMTPDQEEQLTDDNITQTQALYGAPVYVISQQGDWSEVAVPGQPSPKSDLGYPGWIPTRQLTSSPSYGALRDRRPFALVDKEISSWLYSDPLLRHRSFEVATNTRLPVLATTKRAVLVTTPDRGVQWLPRDRATVYKDVASIPRPTGADLVRTAKTFLDQKYIWAGRSAFAFDCSGFTSTIYELHGITIPRDSGPQSQDPAAKPVATGDLQPGDLLFYSHSSDSSDIYHVAMYAGDGQMIEAYDHLTPVRLTPARLGENYWGAVRYLP